MRRNVTAALLFLFAACQGSTAELGKAVREYDDALVRAYAAADATTLASVATVYVVAIAVPTIHNSYMVGR